MSDNDKPAPKPTCFLDTETTSARPGREVWEIAVIRRAPDQRPGEGTPWSVFLPVTLRGADPFALKVGGFYDRHPYGRYLAGLEKSCPGCLLPEAGFPVGTWRDLARMLDGSLVVGAVPSFDEVAIDRPLRRAGVLPAHDYHLIDVGTLAAGWLAGQGRVVPPGPWRSGDLAEMVGVPKTPDADRHQAPPDAFLAMRIYDRVIHGHAADVHPDGAPLHPAGWTG